MAASVRPVLCSAGDGLLRHRWRKNTDDARGEAKDVHNAEGGDDDDSDDSDSVPAAVRSGEDFADLSDEDDVFAPRAGGTRASVSSAGSALSGPSSARAPGTIESEEKDMCDDADFESVPAASGNKRKRLVQADSDSE